MHKISEGYLDEHQTELVKCPRCESTDVVAKITEDGFFWVYQCNACGYIKKETSEKNSK